MSFGKKLLDILLSVRPRHTSDRSTTSRTVVVKHSSTKIITGDGIDITVDEGTLSEMAAALGLQETELRQMLGQGTAESIAEILRKHTGSGSVEVRRNVNPATRVECHDCHRTVAHGNGYCVYCGAWLAIEEKAASSMKTVQQQVDEQYVNDADAAQPQKPVSQDEHQNFLRRISHM